MSLVRFDIFRSVALRRYFCCLHSSGLTALVLFSQRVVDFIESAQFRALFIKQRFLQSTVFVRVTVALHTNLAFQV